MSMLTRPTGLSARPGLRVGFDGHQAVGWLVATHARLGRTVSIPIGAAPYDLIVDDGGELTCLDVVGQAVARPPGAIRHRAACQLGLFGPPDPAPLAPVGLPEPPTSIRRDNPRDQGALGLADAVGWFAAHGYLVSIPLIDNQPYDLIVDDGQVLTRVQVKTTSARSPHGVFVVKLSTSGGNQSFHTVKLFDSGACDLLYVLTDDGARFVIPTSAVHSRGTLNLGARVARYRVT